MSFANFVEKGYSTSLFWSFFFTLIVNRPLRILAIAFLHSSTKFSIPLGSVFEKVSTTRIYSEFSLSRTLKGPKNFVCNREKFEIEKVYLTG